MFDDSEEDRAEVATLVEGGTSAPSDTVTLDENAADVTMSFRPTNEASGQAGGLAHYVANLLPLNFDVSSVLGKRRRSHKDDGAREAKRKMDQEALEVVRTI